MVRPGDLHRYVDLTLLATPLQDNYIDKTIISGIQVLLPGDPYRIASY
jgi:hypothetical protein